MPTTTTVVVAVAFAFVGFEAMAVVVTPVARTVVMGPGSIGPCVRMLLRHIAAYPSAGGTPHPCTHHGPRASAD
jgi:hypothetical protein